jgi:membrane protease YdiL (CAAX protease family)
VRQRSPDCYYHACQSRDNEGPSMTWLDHIFVLIFAAIYPIFGFIGYRRFLRKVEAGMPPNRAKMYVETMLYEWLLFALAMIVWVSGDRAWSDLGLSFELTTGELIGAALTAVAIVLLFVQIRQVAKGSQEELQKTEKSFGELLIIMPVNARELARFNLLSITAGIVEETLWRGFLFWYLGHFMPLWTAAIISAVGFGLAHSYQGIANVPRVALVGAMFSGLYLLTGSLLLPIILHAVVDLLQGRMVHDLLRRNA